MNKANVQPKKKHFFQQVVKNVFKRRLALVKANMKC